MKHDFPFKNKPLYIWYGLCFKFGYLTFQSASTQYLPGIELREKTVKSRALRLILLSLGLFQLALNTGNVYAAPNFVYIVADDMNLADLRYMPNVNALLTARGAKYANAYTVDGLCCPSRVSTLTGQYAHNHGVYTNQAPDGAFDKFLLVAGENQTLSTWLSAAGYRTALIGKYLNGYPNPDNLAYIPPGWSEWYAFMQGGQFFNYKMNQNGNLAKYGETEQDYSTDVVSGLTTDFIARSVNDGLPFFVYVAPQAPHSPATPAPRHANKFTGITSAPRSPSFNEADVSDKPLWVQDLPQLTNPTISDLDVLYKHRLQSLLAVDEMVASIVAELINLNVMNNTYVIFTSDQGLLLGEHRLANAKGAAYEEVIHIPYVVRGPGVIPGSTPTRYVLNIDTAPTLLTLAGLMVPDSIDGIAIDYGMPGEARPVPLRGEDPNRFLMEQVVDLDLASFTMPAFNALRTSRYTYVEHGSLDKELYDNLADGYQLKSKHDAASSELLQQLSTQLNILTTCEGISCHTGR